MVGLELKLEPEQGPRQNGALPQHYDEHYIFFLVPYFPDKSLVYFGLNQFGWTIRCPCLERSPGIQQLLLTPNKINASLYFLREFFLKIRIYSRIFFHS